MRAHWHPWNSTPIIPRSGAPNSAARWLTPRGPGNSEEQTNNERKWTTPSEDETVEWPARRRSTDLSDEEGSLRPFESRMKSAERYYAPREVGDEDPNEEEQIEEEHLSGHDGLGHHGDPGDQSDKDDREVEWIRLWSELRESQLQRKEKYTKPHTYPTRSGVNSA